MERFRIVVGNIGAGKSTLIKQWVEDGFIVLSKDAIRYMLGGGKYLFDLELEKTVDNIAIETFITIVDKGLDVIVDETNMTVEERKDYLDIIQHYNPVYEKECYIMPKISKEESVRRRLGANHGDTPKEVWEQVWERKNKEYIEPTEAEGFDKVVKL